jgi:hypothetical protein
LMDGQRGGADIMSLSAAPPLKGSSRKTSYHGIPLPTHLAVKNSIIQARDHTRSQQPAVSAPAESERNADVLFMSVKALLLSLESPAKSELHTNDSVGISNA